MDDEGDRECDLPACHFCRQHGAPNLRGLIVAFHTKDALYRGEARRMKASADRLNLTLELQEVGTSSWLKIVRSKVDFLIKQRRKLRGPLLYVDVDAVFHSDPWIPLAAVSADVSFAVLLDNKARSGTVYLNDTEGAARFLEDWRSRLDGAPEAWDQHPLNDIVTDCTMGKDLGYSWSNLPPGLCFIFDLGKSNAGPGVVPIIEHLQASREITSRGNARHSRRQARIEEIEADLKSEPQHPANENDRLHQLNERLGNKVSELTLRLDLERDQRAAIEAKLAKSRRVNATLLIVRGRFEATVQELARLAAEHKAVQKRASDAGEEIKKLQAAIVTIRDDRAARLAERAERIRELSRSVKRLETARDQPPQRSARAGSFWRSLMPGNELRRFRKTLGLVKNSGLFDSNYYSGRYADLRGSPDDLLKHYVRTGGGEGRAPSAAFDSAEYLRKYPDVAAAGLNPLVHFLQSGQAEGRTFMPVKPDVEPTTAPGEGPADTSTPATLPDQFAHLATGVSDWLKSSNMRASETLEVGGVPIAVQNQAVAADATAALSWFDALNGQRRALVSDDAAMAVRRKLDGDRLAIDDVWFSDDFELRFRLSVRGGESLVVRCCQQGADGTIVLLAERALGAHGSCVVEIRLASRFNAVLLALTDREGELLDSTLLPFPTLLRGGLHHGELINCGRAPTGWGAHDFYASRLLKSYADRSTKFAVGEVAVSLDGANGTEPIFSKDFGQWLSRQFGIGLAAQLAAGCSNPALPVLAGQMRSAVRAESAAGRSAGRTLILGANSIPSLNVLLARETDFAGASAVRTIMVDGLTRRPLRGVDHPVMESSETLLSQAFEPPLRPGPAGGAKSPVIAFSFRGSDVHDVRAAFPRAGDLIPAIAGLAPVEDGPISVIIDCCGDLDGLIQLLVSLAQQHSASDIECLLVGSVPDVPDSGLLPFEPMKPITLVRTGLESLISLPRLQAALLMATHDRTLVIDDRKALHDPRTLGVLAALCARDEHGTAGCQLVTETIDKNEVRQFKVSAAYLYLGGEGRHEGATWRRADDPGLPSLYPVLANPLECMMTMRDLALSALSDLNDTEHDASQAALALGRAMNGRGKLNVATSVVSVFNADTHSSHDVAVPLDAVASRRFVALEEY